MHVQRLVHSCQPALELHTVWATTPGSKGVYTPQKKEKAKQGVIGNKKDVTY